MFSYDVRSICAEVLWSHYPPPVKLICLYAIFSGGPFYVLDCARALGLSSRTVQNHMDLSVKVLIKLMPLEMCWIELQKKRRKSAIAMQRINRERADKSWQEVVKKER